MSELESNIPKSGRPWVIYCKAVSFLLPPLAVFAFASIFVLPKIKQMCADVGYNPRDIFGPMDFVRDQWLWLTVAFAVLIAAFEKFVPLWRKYRAAFVGAVVFLVNSAILIGLVRR